MSYCWSLTWLISAAGLWAFYPEPINYPSSLDLLIAYIFSRCVCAELLFFFVENAVLGVVRSGPLTDRCVLYPLVNVCSNFEKEFLADNVVGASSLVFLWPPNTFCYFILLVANGWQFRLSFFFLTGYVLTVSLSLSQSSCLDSIYSFFYVTIVPFIQKPCWSDKIPV